MALAEEGWTDGPIVEAVAHRYLDDLFAGAVARPSGHAGARLHALPGARADAGPGARSAVSIVDSAATTAAALAGVLDAGRACAARRRARARVPLLATDGAERFARVGGTFLGRPVEAGRVEIVDL